MPSDNVQALNVWRTIAYIDWLAKKDSQKWCYLANSLERKRWSMEWSHPDYCRKKNKGKGGPVDLSCNLLLAFRTNEGYAFTKLKLQASPQNIGPATRGALFPLSLPHCKFWFHHKSIVKCQRNSIRSVEH